MTRPLVQAVYPRKTARGWRLTLVGWNFHQVLGLQLGGLDLVTPVQQSDRELVFSIPSAASAVRYSAALVGDFGELSIPDITVADLVNLDPYAPQIYTEADYTDQALQLLPKGQAWTRRIGTTMWKLMGSISAELARIHARSTDLVNEVTPSQVVESIPDWETELGLPEKCTQNLSPTIEGRRLEIFRKATTLGGQSPQYYEDQCALMGYKAIVEELYQTAKPFKAGLSKAGDKLTQGAWFFTWRIILQIPDSSIHIFKAGQGRAGDPLRWWGYAELECFLNSIKPSHTILIFSYVSSLESYMVGDTGEFMAGDNAILMQGVV